MRKLTCKSRFFFVATLDDKTMSHLAQRNKVSHQIWWLHSSHITRQGEVHLFSFLSWCAGRYFGGWNISHKLGEIQSVLKKGRTAKIHWNHLAIVGGDGHCFIKTKNQYQRKWKAPENMETCHGRHDLKTPISFPLGLYGFTDTWRETMDSETSCQTPECCCVCLGVFESCKHPCAPARMAMVVKATLNV